MTHHFGELHDRRSSIVVFEISHRINVVQGIEQEMWTQLKLQKLEFRSQLTVPELNFVSLGFDQIGKKPNNGGDQIEADCGYRPDKIGISDRPVGHPENIDP